MRSSFFCFLYKQFICSLMSKIFFGLNRRIQEIYPKTISYYGSRSILACIDNLIVCLCCFFRPLFSSGFLRTVQALLDQTRQDEMQIVGCQSLFEFVNNQVSFLHIW